MVAHVLHPYDLISENLKDSHHVLLTDVLLVQLVYLDHETGDLPGRCLAQLRALNNHYSMMFSTS